MKQILITGASGFIGKRLSLFFMDRGYHVTGIGTSLPSPFSKQYPEFEWISADTRKEGKWQESVAGADIIINLAGRTIFRYWTRKYKQAIYDSRILTTKHIVDAVQKNGKTKKLLTTSAVGIYGDCRDEILTEKKEVAHKGEDRGFLSGVCMDWEAQALNAGTKGVDVIVMRFGVVLGEGGALSSMVPPFKFFIGGPLGNGRHWFPWIHIEDLEKAIEFILVKDLGGTFNFVAPEPVQQKEFAKKLGRVLNRPAFIPAPAFIIRWVMGDLGASLLQSQRAVPENLRESGFSFHFPEINSALQNLLGK